MLKHVVFEPESMISHRMPQNFLHPFVQTTKLQGFEKTNEMPFFRRFQLYPISPVVM